MRVKFWGTRGSIATPGPDTIRYGGNTSCVSVTTDSGACLIFDCGTGARALGADLMAHAAKPISATILLSHTHWDHIQGFPFFAPLFMPGNKITVCGPEGSGGTLREVLAGQMEFTYFPVEIGQLPASIEFRELGEGTHEINGVTVVAQFLHHPAMTLGYRIEADGASVLYLCDHEPYSEKLWHDSVSGRANAFVHEGDGRHAWFMADAGLVIHDSQYTPEEYPAKKNWGHSTYEYAVGIAASAGVRHLVLTHHDPTHNDDFVADIERRAREYALGKGYDIQIHCAFEGLDLEVEVMGDGQAVGGGQTSGVAREGVKASHILVVDDDPDIRALAKKALSQDGHKVSEASNGAEALEFIEMLVPDLLVLDLMMPEPGGLDVLKALRARAATAALPVVILTALDDEATTRAGFETGATDFLTSDSCARRNGHLGRLFVERRARCRGLRHSPGRELPGPPSRQLAALRPPPGQASLLRPAGAEPFARSCAPARALLARQRQPRGRPDVQRKQDRSGSSWRGPASIRLLSRRQRRSIDRRNQHSFYRRNS